MNLHRKTDVWNITIHLAPIILFILAFVHESLSNVWEFPLTSVNVLAAMPINFNVYCPGYSHKCNLQYDAFVVYKTPILYTNVYS